MQVERGPPRLAQPRRRPGSFADERLADLHVASFLECRQLLGQRGIRQPNLIADELEVGPVGGRQQRDDREPGGRVDQLVESGRLHRSSPALLLSMSWRNQRPSTGPPAAITAPPTAVAIVAGAADPAARSAKAMPSVRPTISQTKPT